MVPASGDDAMRLTMTVLLSGLVLGACSVIGVRDGTEEPAYEVVEHIGDIEIRTYGPRIAAQTLVEGAQSDALSAGFRRLAGYIFGGNRAKAKIAMTAPVGQSGASTSEKIAMTAPVASALAPDGRWVVQFFMPKDRSLASLPEPDDARVELVTVAAQRFAVLRYTGLGSVATQDQKRAELLAGLQAARRTTVVAPVAWFYDPPWAIPFLRRNEMAVELLP